MDELDYLLALTQMKGIGSIRARQLLKYFGSAKAVFDADASTLMATHAGEVLLPQIDDPKTLSRAKEEREWIEEHHIQMLAYGAQNYPHRLLEIPDAPALLFYLGDASLEASHVVSIVGTRTSTQYGRDAINALVKDLSQALPDTLIVSGLAMGIDVTAHSAALSHRLPTVGVLAHGLDRIYPYQHRNVAKEMIQQHGGLLSEYTTRTEPCRGNFLARNRIIAALADVVVVGESKERGGSLVTARIANSYSREVMAFPGRATDDRSKGCNALIRNNQACLITCAADLMKQMCWEPGTILFPEYEEPKEAYNQLSVSARRILDILHDQGAMMTTDLAYKLHTEQYLLTEELLQMELDGLIRTLPGNQVEATC